MKLQAILVATIALLLRIDAGLIKPYPELTQPLPGTGGELINPLPGTGGEIINTLPGTGVDLIKPLPGTGGELIKPLPGNVGGLVKPLPGPVTEVKTYPGITVFFQIFN